MLRAGCAAVLAVATLAVPTAAPSATAAAATAAATGTGAAPATYTAQPDAITVRLRSGDWTIDLVANDANATGLPAFFCGTYAPEVDGTPPPGTSGSPAPDGLDLTAGGVEEPAGVATSPPLRPGTYVVTYAACTRQALVGWGDLTVTVLPRLMSAVRVEPAGRPGRLRVVNGHDEPLRFVWGAFERQRADGEVTVPAHGEVRVRVDRPSVLYVALLTLGLHADGLRHLPLARGGRHRAEGYPTSRHSPYIAALASCWGRRAMAPFVPPSFLVESDYPPSMRCR